MSGGHFDYAYKKLENFAEELDRELRHNGDAPSVDDCGDSCLWQDFSEETVKKLREIQLQAQRLAYAMKEVEWLYSGDSSEESFMFDIKQLEDEIKLIEEQDK